MVNALYFIEPTHCKHPNAFHPQNIAMFCDFSRKEASFGKVNGTGRSQTRRRWNCRVVCPSCDSLYACFLQRDIWNIIALTVLTVRFASDYSFYNYSMERCAALHLRLWTSLQSICARRHIAIIIIVDFIAICAKMDVTWFRWLLQPWNDSETPHLNDFLRHGQPNTLIVRLSQFQLNIAPDFNYYHKQLFAD